jgi:hypothetical protein
LSSAKSTTPNAAAILKRVLLSTATEFIGALVKLSGWNPWKTIGGRTTRPKLGSAASPEMRAHPEGKKRAEE